VVSAEGKEDPIIRVTVVAIAIGKHLQMKFVTTAQIILLLLFIVEVEVPRKVLLQNQE
jgi:hypothetical protein